MKLKIYKALPAYSGYLASIYGKEDSLKNKSFPDQLERIRKDCFQWILSWGKYNNDPNIEVFETILNDYHLQQAWANELISSMTEDWRTSIVLDQIKSYKPHVCLLYSPEIFTPEIISRIKDTCPHIIIGGYDGMDRRNISLYKGYDFVITCSKYISEYYQRNAMPTFHMCFGFDEDILRLTVAKEKRYFCSFSGSVFPGIHDDRFKLLSSIMKHEPVTIGSEFAHSPNGRFLSRHTFREIKSIPLGRVTDYLRIYRQNIGPIYGIEMFQFLRDSRLVLNMHGDKIGFAANIRLYEATGVGSCLLTDWKENLPELFEPGKEILAYHSAEEAVDLIEFCKKHPEFCKAIASNGQKRTLADYSQRKVVPEVIHFIKQMIN